MRRFSARYSHFARTSLPLSLHTNATTLDEEFATYTAVDIVVNVAADDLILCFMHAVRDTKMTESSLTHWCGTPAAYMDDQEVTRLCWQLKKSFPIPSNPTRVFQILLKHDNSFALTWPPHQTGREDYARLATTANARPGERTMDAKTSCTRRSRTLHFTPLGHTETTLISYGTNYSWKPSCKQVCLPGSPIGAIVFACHRVIYSIRPLPSPHQRQTSYKSISSEEQDRISAFINSQKSQLPSISPHICALTAQTQNINLNRELSHCSRVNNATLVGLSSVSGLFGALGRYR